MAETETSIFRASLKPEVYRDFEISSAGSLYTLAQAIVRFFDFDFDHAFGFYSGLKGNIYRSPTRYELFVDIGEGEGNTRSVKRTRGFPVGRGQDAFSLRLRRRMGVSGRGVGRKPKEPEVRLPRLLLASGEASAQYPDPEDE